MNHMKPETNEKERITRQLFTDPGESGRFNVYLSTHRGRVRSGNEDNFTVNNVYRLLEDAEKNLMGTGLQEPLVCAVFDGMGGEANGELASGLGARAASLISAELKKSDEIDVDALVSAFVDKGNSAIIDMLESTRSKRGGSTFVMTIFYQGLVYPYSLGDSRIYLYRNRRLHQLSNDQTLAMKKLRANIFTEEEAMQSPDRHKLTSFLGVDVDAEGLEPQIYQPFMMKPGDRLLLCSDGLYDMCPDEQIARLLPQDADLACLSLVKAALENGGEDNVTCIVIERAE